MWLNMRVDGCEWAQAALMHGRESRRRVRDRGVVASWWVVLSGGIYGME